MVASHADSRTVTSTNEWSKFNYGLLPGTSAPLTHSQDAKLLLQFNKEQKGYHKTDGAYYSFTVPAGSYASTITFKVSYLDLGYDTVYLASGTTANKVWEVNSMSSWDEVTKTISLTLANKPTTLYFGISAGGAKGPGQLFANNVNLTVDSYSLNYVVPSTSSSTAPTLSLSASPTSVASGSGTTLTWNSSNASSCSASGAWSGSQATSGSVKTAPLTANSTYILTCSGSGGSVSQQTAVSLSSTTSTGQVSTSSGTTVSAAPMGLPTPAGGWSVEYADAFGSCLTDPATSCSAHYARLDNTLNSQNQPNGDGNPNEIAAFIPQYNDITSAGLDEQCRAVPNLGDSYSCGALHGLAANSYHWNPGPNTHIALQFSAKLPSNEGNMDPAVWATGPNWAWEIDFPEFWGWNHYPTTANTWCNDSFGFPAVPHDVGGATGEAALTFCQSPGANFDPSAAFHTYTLWENGLTFTAYIDGVQVASHTYSTFNNQSGKWITQNDMRADNQTGLRTDSHFPAGGNDFIIRYLAAYEPASASHTGSNGPIIVPGTTVN